jgi:hypothetical protein
MSAQDRELLAQSMREAARSQQIMAGRIADELREVYRNLDLRPQIIPVPVPQIVVPQGRPVVAAGEAGVPPGLEIAGIPRYAREEELPEEPEAGTGEVNWDEAFAGLEPFPDKPEDAGEVLGDRREAGPERRADRPDRRETSPDRREGHPDRRETSPDRREGHPDRRETRPDRRAAPPAGGQPGGARQQLKDYLAKVREKLETPPEAEQPPAERPPAEQPSAERPPAEQPPAAGVPPAEGPLALLEELGEYLPKRQPERRKKNVFMRSDARLKLDYLKSRLEGHKGLMQKIEQDYSPGGSTGSVSLQKVADALIFMKEMAGHYPDPSVGTMMQSKVDSILRRIKR